MSNKDEFIEWWESRHYDDEDKEIKKAAWAAWQAARAGGEPVGFTWDAGRFGRQFTPYSDVADRVKSDGVDVSPVYTHPPATVPEWIYDGYAVYSCLSDKAKTRTSTDNVSDTLDAIKVMLTNPPTQERE